MSKSEYIGVTVGPIYDTIRLTSKPAGLWAASYLFSHITRLLCKKLVEYGVVESEEAILSPYYRDEIDTRNGVGLFHDRIIFIPRDQVGVALKRVKQLFDEVSDEIADAISDVIENKNLDSITEERLDRSLVRAQLRQYLQFHAVAVEAEPEEAFMVAGQPLDALELEKTVPTAFKLPLGSLMENNKQLKQLAKGFGVEEAKWALLKDKNNLKELADITGLNNKGENDQDGSIDERENAKNEERDAWKIRSYYAIVQSDGDRMTNYIQNNAKTPEGARAFSQTCLAFCKGAAEIIHGFGGITIYAGGDDLLFIAPLTGTVDGKQTSLLGLLKKLQTEFNSDRFFGGAPESPTISFGVAVCYHKYPLYEAFDLACDMLFAFGKRNRNALAVSMQKHSGQSIQFVIEQFSFNPVTKLLCGLIDQYKDEDWLKSVALHIDEQIRGFDVAIEQFNAGNSEPLNYIFPNTFDHDDQIEKKDIEQTKQLLLDVLHTFATHTGRCAAVRAIENGDTIPSALRALDALLRFVKFYSEKGEEANV